MAPRKPGSPSNYHPADRYPSPMKTPPRNRTNNVVSMDYPTPTSTPRRVQTLRLRRNNNETLPALEIYPKLDPVSRSNIMPTFQIPTPPATPQKKKPVRKSSDHHLSAPNVPVQLDNQLSLAKVNITPKSTPPDVNNNLNSPGIHDIEALSRLINKRSQNGRKIGVCERDPFAKEAGDETSDKENEFFRKLPSQIPHIILLGPTAVFQNGQSLKPYQAADLAILLRRERGEKVCGTDTVNNVGYILAYEMGYGKTVETIALILINPASKDHKGSKATLVVTPNKGIMSHWQSEVEKFAPHLKVCYYDSISAPLDRNADVVLVTYSQLRFQHRAYLREPYAKSAAPIFHLYWYRSILDEAHMGRNPLTMTAAAMWAIPKRHGLCLSGTPAQNSPLDLFSLFVFLGVTYLNINDLETYQRKIYAMGQKGPISCPEAIRLMTTLLKNFCIFRGKIDPATGKDLIKLPKRTDEVITVTLTAQEQAVYEHVTEKSFGSIFAKIIRLRQVCDHPVLLTRALDSEITEEEEEDGHKTLINESSPALSISTVSSLSRSKALFDLRYISSKLATALKILKLRTPEQKTIIFTHFTSMIPSISKMLDGAKIGWTKYTGDMTTMERDTALKTIAVNDKCTVIIVSILAGGVGLNITVCSTVIMLEPWWNPYVEEQAISRVYRIGQKLPVYVYRLVTQGTIEEAIVKTQKLKRETMGRMYSGNSGLDVHSMNEWLKVSKPSRT